jgi:hypothetical protein
VSKSGAVARLFIAGLFTCTVLRAGTRTAAQEQSAPAITSPKDGDILLGQISIKGTTQVSGFSSAELAFAYASDPTHTWFTIQTASLPANGDSIATWETSQITDGDYVLRLRVILVDGSAKEATVGVRVRNYTAVPTPSPAITPTEPPVVKIPTAIIIAASETATLTALPPISTPSALPPNPAGVTPAAIYSGFWRGALVVGLVVLLFGVLVRWRR